MVAPVPTVRVCVLSLLVRKFAPGLYTAVIVYVPAAVPPSSTKVALAAPDATVPDVTGVPIAVPPCVTVNVTVPTFTVPPELVTVADNVTFWLLPLNTAVAFAPVVVVAVGGGAPVAGLKAAKPAPQGSAALNVARAETTPATV
jgi:hypothetical protein